MFFNILKTLIICILFVFIFTTPSFNDNESIQTVIPPIKKSIYHAKVPFLNLTLPEQKFTRLTDEFLLRSIQQPQPRNKTYNYNRIKIYLDDIDSSFDQRKREGPYFHSIVVKITF